MKNFEVRQGGFYVSEKKGLVREVTLIDGEGFAHWRSYVLRDRTPTGDSLKCATGRIAQWADREATPNEVAEMKRQDPEAKERMKFMGFIDGLLELLPDERLFAEVQRRGRRVI
jgi:hypothetical protein